jgi:hypothetical protein
MSESSQSGPFYILTNPQNPDQCGIYYSWHDSVAHNNLWAEIVSRVFYRIENKDFEELLNCVYGADRGRVVNKDGAYILYGTANCSIYLNQLEEIYSLPANYINKIGTDEHYRIDWQQQHTCSHILQLNEGRFRLATNEIIY